jgi:hypothetical protein
VAAGVQGGMYFSFVELFGGNDAIDRVRQQRIPKSGVALDYLGVFIEPRPPSKSPHIVSLLLDEAFTSENWIVSRVLLFLNRLTDFVVGSNLRSQER